MDDQCAKESNEKFNLKKIQNHWFIEAGGKLHRLSILNNANCVHIEENVIFSGEFMYQVIVEDSGKLKIDKIEDLCKSIGQEKKQPDKEQPSEDDQSDSDNKNAGVLQDTKGTLNLLHIV
jgi:predicted DNA binding protein